MPNCWKCGKAFHPVRKIQRFCCPEHRIAYNNDRKLRNHVLTPRNEYKLQEIADAQGRPTDEMLNEMLTRFLHPDGMPLTDAEAQGINESDTP